MKTLFALIYFPENNSFLNLSYLSDVYACFSFLLQKLEIFCCALNFKVYIRFKNNFPHLVKFSRIIAEKSCFFAIFRIFDQKMCMSVRHGRYDKCHFPQSQLIVL